MRFAKLVAPLVYTALLTACGGGGGVGSSSPPSTPIVMPTFTPAYVEVFQPSAAGSVDITQGWNFGSNYTAVSLVFANPTTSVPNDSVMMLVGSASGAPGSVAALPGAAIYVSMDMGLTATYALAPGIAITSSLSAPVFGGWYAYTATGWQLVSSGTASGSTESFAPGLGAVTFTQGTTYFFALK